MRVLEKYLDELDKVDTEYIKTKFIGYILEDFAKEITNKNITKILKVTADFMDDSKKRFIVCSLVENFNITKNNTEIILDILKNMNGDDAIDCLKYIIKNKSTISNNGIIFSYYLNKENKEEKNTKHVDKIKSDRSDSEYEKVFQF